MTVPAFTGGCFDEEDYRTSIGDLIYMNYRNDTPRELELELSNNGGAPHRVGILYPYRSQGPTSFGCRLDAPAWSFRFNLRNESEGFSRSYHWSDVGCGVRYEFTFRGPDDVSLVLIEKDAQVTKTDLPRK